MERYVAYSTSPPDDFGKTTIAIAAIAKTAEGAYKAASDLLPPQGSNETADALRKNFVVHSEKELRRKIGRSAYRAATHEFFGSFFGFPYGFPLPFRYRLAIFLKLLLFQPLVEFLTRVGTWFGHKRRRLSITATYSGVVIEEIKREENHENPKKQ